MLYWITGSENNMSSVKRCRHCKEYFDQDTMIKVPLGYFCTFSHASQHGIDKQQANKEKAFKQRTAKLKAEYYASDLKTRKAAAKKACHDYIKLRDKGLPCICCGEPMTGEIHAGHWLESGNHPFIRYHEDNIHSQRAYCNTYKGGNSDDYEGRLRVKIGAERVDWLIENKSNPIKRTAQDYKEIEEYFKAKIKAL